MIAYYIEESTWILLATEEDWGLVQNSISNITGSTIYGINVLGNPWLFTIDGTTYAGLGWWISQRIAKYVINERNAVQASSIKLHIRGM